MNIIISLFFTIFFIIKIKCEYEDYINNNILIEKYIFKIFTFI